MANQLKVAEVQSILLLRERGWSCRRIARALGVHRETVGRHVRLAASASSAEARGPDDSKPATPGGAPTGSVMIDSPKPATAPTGSLADMDVGWPPEGTGADAPGRARPGLQPSRPDGGFPRSTSGCWPHRQTIVEKLRAGLSAVRIHQDLLIEHGEAVPSYYSVRRFIGRLQQSTPLPFRRMECEPGAEAQVDFGTGAPIIGAEGKKRRRTHVLRPVLSHSRKGYSESVFKQSTEEFIRCLENAFWHWGGVPATLVLDNLRAAVSKADWFDPELNPKVQSFCRHYGIAALPTKPRMPRHKGKVERGIAYVQDNGLKGHTFKSLAEQNAHLRQWEATVADTRIHGTTKRQVQQVFEQAERPALRPLPATRFPSFEEGQRIVNRDGHVEVAKAYYSAPPEYLGRTVWARWDARMVRLFDARMRPIAVHARKEEGRFSTQDKHIVSAKINSVERGAAYLLQKAENIGSHAGHWSRAMMQHRGVEGVRVLQGLLSLAGKHPGDRIDWACEIALSHGAFRLRTLRTLVRRDVERADKQELLPGAEFIEEHPIIRDLADYGELVHQTFLQGASA